jgi:hypothetical protein
MTHRFLASGALDIAAVEREARAMRAAYLSALLRGLGQRAGALLRSAVMRPAA